VRARSGLRALRTRRGRIGRAACALLLLLLPACISEQHEQQLGDEMAANINAQIPLVHNPLLNAYLTSLGQAIASVSQRPALHYRFYIINSATVNAFALPGGHVYVTRGLIERTESAPELAGVLAHEIGHVVERHGVEKLQRHLRTGSLVSVMYNILFGGEPGLLRENAVRLSGVLWSASHSREDEEEADELAVEYLLRAGVNPDGIVTLLETLLAEEQADTSRVASWFSTHPLTAQRIQLARAEIRDERDETKPVADLQLTSYPSFLKLVGMLPPPPDQS
jgi:predicted Zn-dependent protease